jgi:hypothetical protein
MRIAAKARALAQAAQTKAYNNWVAAVAKGPAYVAAAAAAWGAYLSAWRAAQKADSDFDAAVWDYQNCLGLPGGINKPMKLKKKSSTR